MELLLTEPYLYLDVFLLVMVRILGIMILMPFIGNSSIPAMVRVGLAFFISIIIINIVPLEIGVSSNYPVSFALVVLKEFVTGWLIGMGAYMVFAILTLAGQFIDYQIGFSMVNVFDPLSSTSVTITGNFYYFLFLMVFLSSRSYAYIFTALKMSFEMIPLGKITLSTYLYNSYLQFFNDFFLTALMIAAPIFFVMLIVNAVLGILARTVPQLNMFVIGFPIKILLGLFALYILSYLYGQVSTIIFDKFVEFTNTIIKGMTP